MLSTQRHRIGVLRGGPSREYDFSLATGKNILRNMPEEFIPVDIFVSKDGLWHEGGFEKTPGRILGSVDAVVNAMHGSYGEDGTVQKILDQFGTPYTGSPAVPSAVSMNKILTKKILERYGVRTPLYVSISKAEALDDMNETVERVFRSIPFPLVVKPAQSGSSLGLSLVYSKADISNALHKAFSYGDTLLAEEYIDGKEATCGVIDDFRQKSTYVLLPVEVVVQTEGKEKVFDNASKYGYTHALNTPGNFSDTEKSEIERISELVHMAMGLRHYSRSDFRVHPKRGVYCLEVNSLPDLSEKSSFVKSLESVGSNIKDFLGHLIHKTLNKRS
jgi:D-alanine-D-alanine ligase